MIYGIDVLYYGVTGMRMDGFKRLMLLALASLCIVMPMRVAAQGEREIALIAELGVEMIAQREAAQAAAAEAAHRELLEEQSRLKALYQDYLGEARRTAQRLVAVKRGNATQASVDQLRGKARLVIDEVTDATKQRVRSELDTVFAELEAQIAITPEQLLASSNDLNNAYRKLSRAQNLDWVNRAAILYALCPSREEAEVIANNVKLREKLSDDEAQSIGETNRRRLILGLNPLAIDYKLVECSRDHSKDMVEKDFFSHTSPVPGKEKFTDRAKNFGTKASGENIAAGYGNGYKVTVGWWYSPGHLKNMMNPNWQRVAVGQHQQHYTQMFGR